MLRSTQEIATITQSSHLEFISSTEEEEKSERKKGSWVSDGVYFSNLEERQELPRDLELLSG